MTVFFSKKCELAIQAVLFLSTLPEGSYQNAGEISKIIKVPKEFVSKVLQTLTNSGLVGSKKGKTGGFYLAKSPSEIRLIEIIEVIDGLEIFYSCVLGFPGCGVAKPCPLHDKWGKLRDEAFAMLRNQTLEDLKIATIDKINDL